MNGDAVRVAHFRELWLAITENWIFNQIKYSDKHIESHVFCYKTHNLDQYGIPNIHLLPARSLYDKLFRIKRKLLNQNLYSRRLIKAIGEINPDIIHSHFGNYGWLEMPIAKKFNIGHIVTFYGYDVKRFPKLFPVWKKRYETLFRRVDKVLCEGTHMAGDIIKLGCPPNKVIVHHLGIALEKIPFQPRRWDNGQPLRVLIAGNFVEKKGIPYALKALGKIKQMVPVKITIIGDAKPQPRCIAEKDKIIKAISENNLSSHTRMLGFQPHSNLLKAAYDHHLFLSPSVTAKDGDTEGGVPVSLIEMAASGMPVVSTEHCDIPEVIKDGESGFLAPEKDISALTERIATLLKQKNNWLSFVENGRKHIEQEYNAAKQGIKLSKIYLDVIKQKVHEP